MELLLLILVIIVLVIAVSSKRRLLELEDKINNLNVSTRELTHEVKGWRFRSEAAPVAEKSEKAVPEPLVVPEAAPAAPTRSEESKDELPLVAHVSPPPLPGRRPHPEPEHIPAPVAPREPSAFESSVQSILAKIWNWIVVGEEHRPQGVTMEFAVATTWLVRIGVMIFVIGIGFFLKYAVNQGWIGPRLRVILATLAGAGLIAGGVRLFRGKYAMLGQGLAGAGFATLYFSFFTAQLPDYQLLGAVTAFALMVLVTAVAGFISVRCNSLLVAVLGLLGGYGTPLMIRGGSESVMLLFSYLLLLGIGMFWIASRREWRLLHYLAFFATCAHVIHAMERWFSPERFWEFLPFLLAFFALFSSVTFVYQLVHRRQSTLLELLFLFLNAGAFTGFAVHCIRATYPREALALLTLGLAVFYILHVALFLKRGIRDRGLLLSFLGLASFFVAITLPIVLSKGWITVSWSLQAFVMLWIASKMRSEFLRQLAYLLYLIVLARFAIVDLRGQFDGFDALGAKEYGKHFVERLFIFGIPIGSFFAAGRLFRHDSTTGADWAVGEENDIRPLPGQSGVGRVCFWIVVALSFLYLNLEVAHTVDRLFDPLVRPGLTLVWIGFAALLLREMLVRRSGLGTVLFGILAAALVVKVLFVDVFWWKPGSDLAFAPREFVPGILMRMLDYGALAAFLIVVARVLAGHEGRRSLAPLFAYAALATLFIYTSLETWTALSQFLPRFRMGGISIYWSLFAVGLLLAGILKRRAALRGIGLILLAMTILKVFIIDLAGLDQLYRIIAFIVLGIVVLAGSFLYFKYSHLFAMEPETKEAE